MRKMNKKGFTIVELVIVIAVIAILSAVLIPTFSGVVDSANKTAAVADAKAVYQEYITTSTLNSKTAEQNLLYVDGGFYVVIKAGQVEDAYSAEADAIEALLGSYDASANTYTLDTLPLIVDAEADADDIKAPETLKKVTVTAK